MTIYPVKYYAEVPVEQKTKNSLWKWRFLVQAVTYRGGWVHTVEYKENGRVYVGARLQTEAHKTEIQEWLNSWFEAMRVNNNSMME